MAEDLGRTVAKELARLTKLKGTLTDKRKALDGEIADVEKQITAAQAYSSALGGKTRKKAAPKATGTRKPREGGIREAILALIKDKPLSRGEIIEARGVKGQKGPEQSISNALSNMKKAGTIKTGEDGKYQLAA